MTKRPVLVAVTATIVVVLLACSARESQGLPWEDALRAHMWGAQDLSAEAPAAKRDMTVPLCPRHPRAVPQALINKRVRLPPWGALFVVRDLVLRACVWCLFGSTCPSGCARPSRASTHRSAIK